MVHGRQYADKPPSIGANSISVLTSERDFDHRFAKDKTAFPAVGRAHMVHTARSTSFVLQNEKHSSFTFMHDVTHSEERLHRAGGRGRPSLRPLSTRKTKMKNVLADSKENSFNKAQAPTENQHAHTEVTIKQQRV